MTKTAELKQAFIKQAHADNKHITLAIFVKELEDEIEVAAWIADNYAQDYDKHIQMHMANMLEAQLKLNAGSEAVIQHLLKHVAELAGITADKLEQSSTAHTHTSVDAQAKQATDALLAKMRLH